MHRKLNLIDKIFLVYRTFISFTGVTECSCEGTSILNLYLGSVNVNFVYNLCQVSQPNSMSDSNTAILCRKGCNTEEVKIKVEEFHEKR